MREFVEQFLPSPTKKYFRSVFREVMKIVMNYLPPLGVAKLGETNRFLLQLAACGKRAGNGNKGE